MLDGLASKGGFDGGVHTIYAIGDNPDTDMAGANAAGGRWRSILTRSGMFQPDPSKPGGGNAVEHPGDYVVEDVGEAYDDVICKEQRAAAVA
jgi:ribonucleotide monophosphatase NagD (HAD superfamily)